MTDLVASLKALRGRVRAARRELESLARTAAVAQVSTAQLTALRNEPGAGLGERLDALTSAFDVTALRAHLATAIRSSSVVSAPVPHAVITDVLPPAVHQAAVAALPPRAFLTIERGRMEMAMPPSRAPVECLIVWRFLTDVLTETCAPLLVEHFDPVLAAHVAPLSLARGGEGEGVRLVSSQGRLILRAPGCEPRPQRPHPWHFLSVVIHLGRHEKGSDTGSIVHAEGMRLFVPYAPNTAVVVFDPTGAHGYAALPDGASAERWSYEFPIGPDGESRRSIGAPL